MQGKQVTNPPASIKLFNMMENMKWAHLPVPGGLYDQHPLFLEEMRFIFSERGKWQEKEQKRRDREQKANSRRKR